MSSRASFRMLPGGYAADFLAADSTSGGGAAYCPVWQKIRAKTSAGEIPTEREWRLLSLENGNSEQAASEFAREIVPAFEAYRAEILAEASGGDVLSLLRSFRMPS